MEERNHDVYNHPVSQNEAEKEQQVKGGNADEHQIAENPNPRANENIVQRNRSTDDTDAANQVGSEITDGEDA